MDAGIHALGGDSLSVACEVLVPGPRNATCAPWGIRSSWCVATPCAGPGPSSTLVIERSIGRGCIPSEKLERPRGPDIQVPHFIG
jgi:hypothetical protein